MQLIHEAINETHTTHIYRTQQGNYLFQLTDYTGALIYERTYSTEKRARQGQFDYLIQGSNTGTGTDKGTSTATNTDYVSAENSEGVDTAG